MKSIIEQIEKGNYGSFHGGIHPPEQKFLTNNKPIRCVPLPEQLILPVQQHIGQAAELLVNVGDSVLKGQALTKSMQPMAVPIHAPTSGKITEIKNAVVPHPSGMEELCIFITPDGEDKWRPRHICNDISQLSNEDIIEKIADAGIAGMGGAGFPTHIKVNNTKAIETLIINAAECEPYITADDLLIREHSSFVVDGIRILKKLLTPKYVLIGIEDNKPEAIKALQNATQNDDNIYVCILPTKYPTGGEKQLIQMLTNQEVPSGVLPSGLGIVMQNIATCFAIADAVINDIPLIKRVVTVTGLGLAKPQNISALLGTPTGYLLDQCGYGNKDKKHVIMGGPMMGYSLPSALVPIVKTSNCILAPSEKEIPSASIQGNNEVECIRCGQCADVCPSQLLPQELQWSAKAHDQKQLETLNLFDCIECGACAYVCPSQIPLVHYYRVAKAEVRQQKLLDIKAEKAKVRFEARKVRLEKEKKAREEKQKKAAEARKARMNSGTSSANNEKSAVAAALARVKAKKAQATSPSYSTESETESESKTEVSIDDTSVMNTLETNIARDEQKDKVAAALARVKAKRLVAKQLKEADNEKSLPANAVNTDLSENSDSSKSTDSPPKDNKNLDDKKAKISAAVAKAKAKKLADAEKKANDYLSSGSISSSNISSSNISSSNISPSNISPSNSDIEKTKEATPVESRKAKIAAAVAKAKAKKQQRSESL